MTQHDLPVQHKYSRLNVPLTTAGDDISSQLGKGNELYRCTINSRLQFLIRERERRKWSNDNIELLAKVFTSPSVAEGCRLSSEGDFSSSNLGEIIVHFRKAVAKEVSYLESIQSWLVAIPNSNMASSTTDNSGVNITSKDVFIVHGHDEATKQAVARLVGQLGLNPIILHEQPSSGRTIIAKFEANAASAAFAVVIMSPDDMGAPATNISDLRPRARQNVIFELGYFIAKLGSERVCALRKEDTEILSDYLGVVYVPVDDGGAWRYKVANEMKAAKINVDLNRIV
ncbi:MAG: nucleotide-binding protein [Chloroflexi bacterium]|nr:nucleotide-binding protein [Chloroflexota bacterium]